MKSNNDSIVARIVEVMNERGLNQTRLASDIGFPQANISLILKQKRGARPLIEKISSAYGVNPAWLFTGLGAKYQIKTEDIPDSSGTSSLTKEERLSLVHELNNLHKRHQDLMEEAANIMSRVVQINEKLIFGDIIA